MTEDLNLTLRTDVLEKALCLEHSVNSILLIYLSIESMERKAITNKSGNLSFRNKIDLLFDLGILTKDEYKCFLLLMEFRNQFLHNIDCISFSHAVSILGKDRGNQLIRFVETGSHADKESQYKEGFLHLYGKTIQITLEKIRIRNQIIDEKAGLLNNLNNNSLYLIDFFFNVIDRLWDKHGPDDNDTPDIFELKSQIFITLAQEISKLEQTEVYQFLNTQLEISHTPEKLRMYFK